VILTPARPPNYYGCYISSKLFTWWERNSEKHARQWGLSKARERSIADRKEAVVLISREYDPENTLCRTLAHEIGHHICHLAKFTPEQLNASVTKTMRRFFPADIYLKRQKSQEEFHSECFAEYLTVSAIKHGIERECEAILSRVRRHNPDAAKLVEQYRTTLLERTS